MAEPTSTTLEILVKLKNMTGQELTNLAAGLNKAGAGTSVYSKAIGGLETGLSRVSSAIFSLKGLIVGGILGATAKDFIEAASSAEQYRFRLSVLLGSIKEANDLYEKMDALGAKIPFRNNEIQVSATKLAMVLKGGSTEIQKWMPIIADVAAVSGMGIEETTATIVRMFTYGSVAARAFKTSGVLSMLGFQEGVNLSAEKSKQKLMESWEAPTSRFRGAAETMSKTWKGMLVGFQNTWDSFQEGVMGAGAFDFLKGLISAISDEIKKIKENGVGTENWFKRFSDLFINGIIVMIRSVSLLGDSFRGLQMIWYGLKGLFALISQGVLNGLGYIALSVEKLEGKLGTFLVKIGRMAQAMTFSDMAVGLGKSLEAIGGIMEQVDSGKISGEFFKQATAMEGIVIESGKEIDNLVKQKSFWELTSELIEKAKLKAAEYAKVAKGEGTDKGVPAFQAPRATNEAVIKSELARILAANETTLAAMKVQYDHGEVELKEYFDKRRDILKENSLAEIAELQALAALEEGGTVESQDKKLAIMDQIFQKEQAYRRDTINLAWEQVDAEKVVAQAKSDIETTLRAIRDRGIVEDRDTLANQQAREREALAARQAQEIQDLTDKHAVKGQMEEAFRLQQLERDKMTYEQRKAVETMYFTSIATTFGNVSQMFSDLYNATGQKVKAFFYISKGAAIVQTTMATYEAAQKAYTAMVGIAYVGPVLAVIAAAAAIAAGMARVQQIKSQSLSLGGSVRGYSPNPKADNIQINATADEFMQPVETVKHYGLPIMEAIRKRLIPKDLLNSVIRNSYIPITRPVGSHYAAGGPVSGPSSNPADEGKQSPTILNNLNILDPSLINQWARSTTGTQTFLNVITENTFQIKQILQQG